MTKLGTVIVLKDKDPVKIKMKDLAFRNNQERRNYGGESMKRIGIILLVAILAIMLTGCASKQAADTTAGNTSTSQTSTSQNESASTKKEPVKIVDVATSEYLAAAVYSDGTAVLSGISIAEIGKEKLPNFSADVEKWTDIIAIAVGGSHVVGLKSDGTVVAAGSNAKGQSDVSTWKDVKKIWADDDSTIALKNDGTMYSTGEIGSVSSFHNVVDADIAGDSALILYADGTCDKVGYSLDGALSGFSSWSNIVDVAYSGACSIALKSDGTCVNAGATTSGRADVKSWTNVVAIDVGMVHTIGLKKDGTVIGTGRDYACNVGSWKDIVKIAAGGNTSIGIKSDGTIVYCGKWTFYDGGIDDWNKKVIDSRN